MSSSRPPSDMAPWHPRHRSLLNERRALLRLPQDRHPTWHPGIRAIAACSTSGRLSFVFLKTAIRHGTLASAPSQPAQRAAGSPSSSSRPPSDMAPWHPRHCSLLNERRALLRLPQDRHPTWHPGIRAIAACSTSGRLSFVFLKIAIRHGTLASAPSQPAQRAAGSPSSSSRSPSDMAPWHPRHRSLLNERRALLRLPQDRHPTWHPGIRAIAACSTSGRLSFVFLKTAIRHGTLASAPLQPAQRAAGSPSSSSRPPSDMAPWHPRHRGLLNERQALLRLPQDRHPTWHPGIRAIAACSTSGRLSFVFLKTAIRHGTLASAPSQLAQRAAGSPSSSSRPPSDMAPWHPRHRGLLNERQALLRLPQDRHPTWHPGIRAIAACSASGRLSFVFLKTAIRHGTLASAPSQPAQRAAGSPSSSSRPPSDMAPWHPRHRGLLNERQALLRLPQDRHPTWHPGIRAIAACSTSGRLSFVFLKTAIRHGTLASAPSQLAQRAAGSPSSSSRPPSDMAPWHPRHRSLLNERQALLRLPQDRHPTWHPGIRAIAACSTSGRLSFVFLKTAIRHGTLASAPLQPAQRAAGSPSSSSRPPSDMAPWHPRHRGLLNERQALLRLPRDRHPTWHPGIRAIAACSTSGGLSFVFLKTAIRHGTLASAPSQPAQRAAGSPSSSSRSPSDMAPWHPRHRSLLNERQALLRLPQDRHPTWHPGIRAIAACSTSGRLSFVFLKTAIRHGTLASAPSQHAQRAAGSPSSSSRPPSDMAPWHPRHRGLLNERQALLRLPQDRHPTWHPGIRAIAACSTSGRLSFVFLKTAIRHGTLASAPSRPAQRAAGSPSSSSRPPSDMAPWHPRHRGLLNERQALLRLPQDRHPTWHPGIRAIAACSASGRLSFVFLKTAIRHGTLASAPSQPAQRAAGSPSSSSRPPSDMAPWHPRHCSLLNERRALLRLPQDRHPTWHPGIRAIAACSTSGGLSFVFLKIAIRHGTLASAPLQIAIRHGTLASAPLQPAQRAAGSPSSSSRPPSDMAPWHPRHRSLLNERRALLRLPQDRHPTWHPGIRAIAACSTSGGLSFVFLKTAIRHGTLASAPSQHAQRAAGSPSSSSRPPSDMAPWHPRHCSLLNERQALLRLPQDRHPTWHPGIRAIAACSTSGRLSFVFLKTAIRHGTLASAPSQHAQRAAGSPSSSSRPPSDMAPWHPRHCSLLNERQALLRLPQDRHPTWHPGIRAIAACSTSGRLSFVFLKTAIRHGTLASAPSQPAQRAAGSPSSSSRSPSDMAPWHPRHRSMLNERQALLRLPQDRHPTWHPGIRAIAACSTSGRLSFVFLKIAIRHGTLASAPSQPAQRAAGSPSSSSRSPSDMAPWHPRHRSLLNERRALLRLPQDRHPTWHPGIRAIAACSTSGRLSFVFLKIAIRHGTLASAPSQPAQRAAGSPSSSSRPPSDMAPWHPRHRGLLNERQALLRLPQDRHPTWHPGIRAIAACSTSGRLSFVFLKTAIRHGTLASAPSRPAQRAAGSPSSSSRPPSDMAPWHPRHRGLLNERQALLRLPQDRHPTWHPGIRAIAACSASGRLSFVFLKTAIRHGTLASAPSQPAQRAAGSPSSSSRPPSDMAPWHPRHRSLLNERQALLRLPQDRHPTWHPGIRAIAACSTSGRLSFVFLKTAIRHGTLASAPLQPAQRAAGSPSSSSRPPSDMAPWHPRHRGLLNERQALLRLPQDRHPTWHPGIRAIAACSTSGRLSFVFLKTAIRHGTLASAPSQLAQRAAGSPSSSSRPPSDMAPWHPRHRGLLNERQALLRLPQDRHPTWHPGIRAIAACSASGRLSFVFLKIAIRHGTLASAPSQPAQRAAGSPSSSSRPPSDMAPWHPRHRGLLNERQALLRLPQDRHPTWHPGIRAIAACSTSGRLSFVFLKTAIRHGTLASAPSQHAQRAAGSPSSSSRSPSDMAPWHPRHRSLLNERQALLRLPQDRHPTWHPGIRAIAACSTSGRLSFVFLKTAIRHGTLASAPSQHAQRAAGSPSSSSRPPSDMAPWHPRHCSLLNERQALLRLPQDRHPTWHPGIRAIAACSTSGRLSFVFLKIAIRHGTLASAPSQHAQRAAGSPSSSSRPPSDMAPWHPRHCSLLNERQALLRLPQDRHPTWHPGIRAIAACSTSGRLSFVFLKTAIRHGTLASAPLQPAQRAAGSPSSSSRPPSDMAPWHPRHRSMLNERQALLRLPQDRHPTWHPGIRAIAACSTSGRLSFVFLKIAIRHGTLASAPSQPAQRAAGSPSSSSRPPSDMAPWHPRHRSLLNERQALLRLPQDRHPTWHPGIRAIAACSTSGGLSFVFLKIAIRHGTLASAPSQPAQRAAGSPSSSSRSPSDMAPWHPRHRSLLNERRALLRLPQDRHPTWHPGIRAIAACSTSGRLSFVFLKAGRFSIHSARPYSPVVHYARSYRAAPSLSYGLQPPVAPPSFVCWLTPSSSTRPPHPPHRPARRRASA